MTIPGTEMNRRLALETGGVDATSLRAPVGDLYGNKGLSRTLQPQSDGCDDASEHAGDDAAHRRCQTAGDRSLFENDDRSDRGYSDPANKELVTRAGIKPSVNESWDAEESTWR